jgi:hypothetical protein
MQALPAENNPAEERPAAKEKDVRPTALTIRSEAVQD